MSRNVLSNEYTRLTETIEPHKHCIPTTNVKIIRGNGIPYST